MNTDNELKELVKQKYSEIASQDKLTNTSSCCGAGGCSTEVYNIMSESYDELQGYSADADLGLGCGLPTEFALIKKGDVVVDLGSGAGNDCFVARAETGDMGKVIGIDFTEAMINKARENADKLGYKNVEFRLGDIESMPLTSGVVDVIVSNCVLNLVPNKEAVFAEMHRVLKPGGHFSISDIVTVAELPNDIKDAAEMYAGCVAGAINKDEYLSYIMKSGFDNVRIQKNKAIVIPDDILSKYLKGEALEAFKAIESPIRSITVFAEKTECVANGNCC